IELHALQDRKAVRSRVPPVDRLPLLPEALRVEPARHRHALRVVGDGDVFVLEGSRRLGHLVDRPLAAGLARVHLEVAAEVRELDEPDAPVLACAVVLAACFAQLGWPADVADPGVALSVGLARYAADFLEKA